VKPSNFSRVAPRGASSCYKRHWWQKIYYKHKEYSVYVYIYMIRLYIYVIIIYIMQCIYMIIYNIIWYYMYIYM
jgi:hypothetical protein